MGPDEAATYHAEQVAVLADSGVDLISAYTLTNIAEAVGIADAARGLGIPVVISFTVETDGCLPSGATLADAVRAVDDATDAAAAHFLVNCAHPDHFAPALDLDDPAIGRIRGCRANASRLSHAELDDRDEIDDGDPAEFGGLLGDLHRAGPGFTVLGGCCGTDARHVAAIAAALAR
jgi:S-methylmethionine-dependent homocysteine/selenocysteine methylase